MVFENIEDYRARIDDPALAVDEQSIWVLKGCGPKGYPGMPEVGNMALPKKLLARGVKDMLRISDARMSGTAFGSVILHAAPEAVAGGPLAVVQDGDFIEFDGYARTLNLKISDAELQRRLTDWAAHKPESPYRRGYAKLYVGTVLQADLDLLVGASSGRIGRYGCAGVALMRAVYPSLAPQAVFITGGASGIGAAFVRAFSGQGARGVCGLRRASGACTGQRHNPRASVLSLRCHRHRGIGRLHHTGRRVNGCTDRLD